MNTAIELHDTFVESTISHEDGYGELHLWAVVHRFEGEFGSGYHDSGWQNICFRFSDMVIDGNTGNGRDYIANGFLTVNGIEDDGLLSFPANLQGDILLSMVMSTNDEFLSVTIRGSTLSVFAEGQFKLERVWEADGSKGKSGVE